MHISEIARQHFAWVESVGWHRDKRPLEYLGLLFSEAGEAVNECRGEKPTEGLGEELADFILRAFDMALVYNIDIEKAIMDKMEKLRLEGIKEGRLK